jgi:hypothetical protein
MPPVGMATCPDCARPLVAGQRYCLECGSRVAASIVPWRPAVPDPAAPPPAAPARARVPRPKTAAVLLLAALGTGTVLGAAATPAPTAAGQASQAIAYVPQAAAATPTPTPAPTPSQDGASLPDDVAPPPAPAAPEPTATPSPPTQTAAVEPAPSAAPTPTPAPDDTFTPPAAKHVVIVSLTGHHYASVFRAEAPSDYLVHELPAQGTLLTRYHGLAGDAAANANALMAGVTALADDTPSLPFTLGTVGKTWKAYVQGTPAPCTPAPRDPFPRLPMLPDCQTADGPLDTLTTDFADPDTAPSLAYVIPDRCHDGSFTTCPQMDADSDGMARAGEWLSEWIPKITESDAFADDGVLVVLFDGDRPDADPAKGIHAGAIVVSRFVRKGAESHIRYDHLSLLRTLAEMLGVDPPGDAAGDDVRALGSDVFR